MRAVILAGGEGRVVTDVEKAYAAGIIDGEGCIGLTKHKRPGARLGYSVVLHVTVTSTNEELVKWFKHRFGGSVRCRFHSLEENRKDIYEWKVDSHRALAFLEKIWEFLLLKCKNAELAIEFQTKKHIGWPYKTVDELIGEDEAWEQMRALNKRGRS